MSEGLGWVIILGGFALMLAIAYIPWYVWVLFGTLVIAIIGYLMWRKHGGAFEGGEEESDD